MNKNLFCRFTTTLATVGLGLALTGTVFAELTDITQTPNAANEGIKKSFTDQVGLNRGDINTPDSSLYIINRDPFRAIVRGRQLFQRKFQVKQGFGPRADDGEGDIGTRAILGAGLADSCAACHGRPRGAAGAGGDVFTRPDSRDAPHLFGIGLVEMLGDEITQDLRAIRDAAIAEAQAKDRRITKTLSSKGISYGRIAARPDGSVDTARVEGVDDDLRVRPFFHEGSEFSIRAFAVGAFKAEMGLEAVDPDLLAASQGNDATSPSGLGLTGTVDHVGAPVVKDGFEDNDNDGKSNEIPTAAVDYLEFYLMNYFKPALYRQTSRTLAGKSLFKTIGCAKCHMPSLTIDHDRRVADVETTYDTTNGIFNNMYATAAARFVEIDDGSGHPTLKEPVGASFEVEHFYSDLKRHDLGPAFHERQFDGSYVTEFVTEPLWGVGSTAPYGHDGRSINLHEVILRHGGEAKRSQRKYRFLTTIGQEKIQAFLQSLQLFPPADTASNLNPGDPSAEHFPQKGHGSVDLSVLFNDPTDPE